MSKFVEPEVYWVGYSEINMPEIIRYLEDTDNIVFLKFMEDAKKDGLTGAEMLCSMFAKLCYKALKVGDNSNVTRVRDIESNLRHCFDAAHGSVLEHCNLNFLVSNCSRLMCNELIRHRAGVSVSQTSGRYVRIDNLEFVHDPILDGQQHIIQEALLSIENAVYLLECAVGLRSPNPNKPAPAQAYTEGAKDLKWLPNDKLSFDVKKKLTSAIRRIAPNGQANEIAFSVNIRALRHIVMLRTSRQAEWEIRFVFNKIYNLVKDKYPTIFHGAKEEVVDGLLEITGMRTQPYEVSDEQVMQRTSTEKLVAEINLRNQP